LLKDRSKLSRVRIYSTVRNFTISIVNMALYGHVPGA
jgi:hypothetical protein